jgi:hypothetical protein
MRKPGASSSPLGGGRPSSPGSHLPHLPGCSEVGALPVRAPPIHNRPLGMTRVTSHCPRNLVICTILVIPTPVLGCYQPGAGHPCWAPSLSSPPPDSPEQPQCTQGQPVDTDLQLLHPHFPDVPPPQARCCFSYIPVPKDLFLGADTPPTSYQFHAQ